MDITSRGKKEYPPRILEYRKQFKLGGNVVKWASFYLLSMGLLTITFQLLVGKTNTNCLWAGIIAIIGGLIVYLEYWFLFKRLIISKTQVYKDKIFISRGKKEITIPFNEVREIKTTY